MKHPVESGEANTCMARFLLRMFGKSNAISLFRFSFAIGYVIRMVQADQEGFKLTFRHRASCILGQAFHYSPENAFYIFNQQIYFSI